MNAIGVAGDRSGKRCVIDAGEVVDPEAGDENIDLEGVGSGVLHSSIGASPSFAVALPAPGLVGVS